MPTKSFNDDKNNEVKKIRQVQNKAQPNPTQPMGGPNPLPTLVDSTNVSLASCRLRNLTDKYRLRLGSSFRRREDTLQVSVELTRHTKYVCTTKH